MLSMNNKTLIENLSGKTTDQVPFWFMRQAGRYLPEYRDLRKNKGGFLDMVYDPKAASEVTLQPIRRFGMKGSILFSDILVIPHALGQKVEFESGHGPKLMPLRSEKDLSVLDIQHIDKTLSPVYETVKLVKSKLATENFEDTALIGFAGSPWTVACYMVDGGGSKTFDQTKRWAYGDPEGFQKLIDIVVEATIHYLVKQVEAGAEALQLFDSWSGILDEENFTRWVIRPSRKIVEGVKTKYPDIKIIGFPREAGVYYADYAKKTGVDALGVDFSIDLNYLPDDIPLQGNLDPSYLLVGGDAMIGAARKILDTMRGRPFIFNLGHGVIKETPPEHVEQLSDFIRTYR
jgi:uroporphyrinogen decarboxylase